MVVAAHNPAPPRYHTGCGAWGNEGTILGWAGSWGRGCGGGAAWKGLACGGGRGFCAAEGPAGVVSGLVKRGARFWRNTRGCGAVAQAHAPAAPHCHNPTAPLPWSACPFVKDGRTCVGSILFSHPGPPGLRPLRASGDTDAKPQNTAFKARAAFEPKCALSTGTVFLGL